MKNETMFINFQALVADEKIHTTAAIELLNEDALGNRICKVKINDKSELDSLMNAEAYKAICE